MWANKNFVLLAIAYSLIYGVWNALGTTMSNLLNPFGYSPTDIAVAGFSSLMLAVFAALAVGLYLDKTTKYRKAYITISFFTIFATVIMDLTFAFTDNTLFDLVVTAIIAGVACVSFFPTSLSYGAELTFPLDPTLVNSIMNLFAQFSSFILMMGALYITDVDVIHLEPKEQKTI